MAKIGLTGLKRRIKSIKNTKKITKAMALIATSKLKKNKNKIDTNNEFFNYFGEILKDILKNNNLENSIYINKNSSYKKIYIALTSDSGLCGGFNASVIDTLKNALYKDKENSSVIIVGEKGKNYLKKFKIKPIKEYLHRESVPNLEELKDIYSYILDLYKKEFCEIYVVYTKFISGVKQQVEIKKLLPLDTEEKSLNNPYIEFEPKNNKLLERIIPFYLKHSLLNYTLNSKTSEQSARMTAMNTASKNADDLLKNLNLKYNRIRQSSITEEISEIIGGSEAQK